MAIRRPLGVLRVSLCGKQLRHLVVSPKMRIGVVFAQTEIGGDPAAVRAYGQRVEELGFAHILAYDHVVGADPEVHQGWQGPYNIDSTFHEPFVVFGYLAALTSLELVTGVIILPQRQSVLVAKQAAEVDLLTGGRFRLGIGLGWNAVEYEALGEEFTNRGRRSEEQVEVMRKLWTERSVTFDGKYHAVTGAGLAPLPTQRPIPVWFGAASDRAYERAGRLGDGWFPMMEPGPGLDYARAGDARRGGRGAEPRQPRHGRPGQLDRRPRQGRRRYRRLGSRRGHTPIGEHHERRPHDCRRPPDRVGARRRRPEVGVAPPG